MKKEKSPGGRIIIFLLLGLLLDFLLLFLFLDRLGCITSVQTLSVYLREVSEKGIWERYSKTWKRHDEERWAGDALSPSLGFKLKTTTVYLPSFLVILSTLVSLKTFFSWRFFAFSTVCHTFWTVNGRSSVCREEDEAGASRETRLKTTEATGNRWTTNCSIDRFSSFLLFMSLLLHL